MATVNDGLRMVGQLLLHRPTTEAFARDTEGNSLVRATDPSASCFCYWGACHAVGNALRLPAFAIENAGVQFFGMCIGGSDWDNACAFQRRMWAQQLADIKEP